MSELYTRLVRPDDLVPVLILASTVLAAGLGGWLGRLERQTARGRRERQAAPGPGGRS